MKAWLINEEKYTTCTIKRICIKNKKITHIETGMVWSILFHSVSLNYSILNL